MPESVLAIDRGTTSSRAILFDRAMPFLAGILGAPVDRPVVAETTALGIAWLAGMRAGLYPGPEVFAADWALERRFEPAMEAHHREAKYAGWKDAVSRTLSRLGGSYTNSR
jgi:glycerol kinase